MDKPAAGLTMPRTGEPGHAPRPALARPVATDAVAMRFADRMARSRTANDGAPMLKGRKSPANPPPPALTPLKGKEGARPLQRRGETEREGEGTAVIGRSIPELHAVAADTVTHASHAALVEPHPALARIAAAVAELHGDAANDAVRIEFPSDLHTTPGGSAMLTRDAQSGAVSIRLTGLVPHATPVERMVMETDLRRGLAARKLRVGDVHWDESAAPATDGQPRPRPYSRAQ